MLRVNVYWTMNIKPVVSYVNHTVCAVKLIFRVIFWWLRGKFARCQKFAVRYHAHNLPDAVNNRWIHSQTSNILFNVWNLRHQNIALPIRHCSSQSKCDREVHLKDVPRLVQYANYQKLLDLEWKFLLYASTPLRYALKTTNEIPISAHYVSQPPHLLKI